MDPKNIEDTPEEKAQAAEEEDTSWMEDHTPMKDQVKKFKCDMHRVCKAGTLLTCPQCCHCSDHWRCDNKAAMCDRKFYNKNHFLLHQEYHQDEADRRKYGKPGTVPTVKMDFVCKACMTYFFKEEELSRHLVRHYGSAPYLCEVCSITYDDVQYFQAHYVKVHGIRRPFDFENTNRKLKEEGLMAAKGWHWGCMGHVNYKKTCIKTMYRTQCRKFDRPAGLPFPDPNLPYGCNACHLEFI